MTSYPGSTKAAAPTTRSVPMQVICLGYGRTGTFCTLIHLSKTPETMTAWYGSYTDILAALRESLLTLGYRHAYHTIDAINRDYYDCKRWTDLLNAREAGKKITREDFDPILGHCQVSHSDSQGKGAGVWLQRVLTKFCMNRLTGRARYPSGTLCRGAG